jgi:hypothetical protein
MKGEKMITETQREKLYNHAASAYRLQDQSGWRFALYAACTGGTYKDLADYIGGVSVDKVESSAHAWGMYRALRREYGPIVGAIRRLPYVYLSHFGALHKIQRRYGLSLSEIYSYLCDVFQGEGAISSRDLMIQAENEHGDEKALSYDADRARSALKRMLSRGDLESSDRELFQAAFDRLCDLSV